VSTKLQWQVSSELESDLLDLTSTSLRELCGLRSSVLASAIRRTIDHAVLGNATDIQEQR
jgi:hypothetical protein